jgi:hypothetical protein
MYLIEICSSSDFFLLELPLPPVLVKIRALGYDENPALPGPAFLIQSMSFVY